MNKTATVIRENLPGYNGVAHLYKVSPFIQGHKYVVVSAVREGSYLNEALVFGADVEGDVTDWNELGGARRTTDHSAALADLGYEVAK